MVKKKFLSPEKGSDAVSMPCSAELVGTAVLVGWCWEGKGTLVMLPPSPPLGPEPGPSLPDTVQGPTWSQTLISPRSMGTSWGVRESSACSLIKEGNSPTLPSHRCTTGGRQRMPQPCGELLRSAPMHRVLHGPSQHQEPQRLDAPGTRWDPAGCCE